MLSVVQKHALVNYHILSRRLRLTTHEGYDIAFMPKGRPPDSAFWRYDTTRHRHNLVISEAVDEIMDRPTKSSMERYRFVQKVYDHEGAHSLFTDRDNLKLNKLRDDRKIPFHLWNMTEDARIEAEWRRHFSRRFDWLRFMLYGDEQPPDPLATPGEPMHAIQLFLDCTHMENSPRKLEEWVKKDKDPRIQFESKGKAKFGRRILVRWYWRRAIRARDTSALVPVIESWIKTFPETAAGGEGPAGIVIYLGNPGSGDMQDPKEGSGKGAGEMPGGVVDADGSDHKECKETITVEHAGSGASESSSTPVIAKKPPTKYVDDEISKPVRIPHNHYFHKTPFRTIDTKRGDSLIHLFEKFLEGGEGMVNSRNPSGRIDMRKFLRGAEDIYLRKGDDPAGVKRISFIMDASGSMSGTIDSGLYLAYVLNELVRRRRIECKSMILSGGDNYSVPMPFHPDLLRYIWTPGGIEGFAHTMREHERDLVASDLTIFFTDGDITDEHIIKADWHRKGVYTIGLFVGPAGRSAKLHQWFDSVLVRDSIEAVADSLVQLIKRS